jgi:hypothetical protein
MSFDLYLGSAVYFFFNRKISNLDIIDLFEKIRDWELIEKSEPVETLGWSSKKPQTMCRLLGESDTTRLVGVEKTASLVPTLGEARHDARIKKDSKEKESSRERSRRLVVR